MQLVLKHVRHKQHTWHLLRAALLFALLPSTGCLSHTRSVRKTRPADVVLSVPLDGLLKQVDDQYNSVKSATAFVQISTSTGGSLQGKVKESIRFDGFIILGKPDQIRVILLLPLVQSKILDMVSDGKTFKMLIPPEKCAIVGSDQVVNTSQKGLYSLRPGVILDSMLIRGLEAGQVVSRTQDIRVIENPKKKNDLIEEPDYDLEFFSSPENRVARTLRVIHISRVNLLPYQQDIYDADGKVATQAFYSDYEKFGETNFPTKIVIQRPLDELGLTITIAKRTTFNQELNPDEFKLDIPEGTSVHNVDEMSAGIGSQASTNPCAVRAPQSPR